MARAGGIANPAGLFVSAWPFVRGLVLDLALYSTSPTGSQVLRGTPDKGL